jgi:hypothetical protein
MEAQGKEWTCPKCKKMLLQNETPSPVVVNEVVDKPKSVESSPAKARRNSATSSASSAVAKKSPKPGVATKTPEKPPASKLIQKRPEVLHALYLFQ